MKETENRIEGLEGHQKDYKPKAWEVYSINELGMWVHLFSERAGHRDNNEKLRKDLYDAKNYLWMIEQNLKNRCQELGVDFDEL